MAEIIDLRKKVENKRQPTENHPGPSLTTPQADKNIQKKEEDRIIWEAFESEKIENRLRPYLFVLSLAIICGFLFYFDINPSLAIILALFDLVVLLNIWREPRKMRYMLNGRGLYMDDAFHPYSEFKSYWLEYQIKDKYIVLTNKNWYLPRIKAYIGSKSPFEIRDLLDKHLDQKRVELGLIDVIAKNLGL